MQYKKFSLFQNCGSQFLIAHNTYNTVPTVPHLHAQYEIYYNICGGEYYFIDGHFISVKPYDLVIIPKLQIHKALLKINTKYESYVVNFDEYIINTLLNMTIIGEESRRNYPFIDLSQIGKTLPYKVHLNITQHEKAIKLFEECRLAEQASEHFVTLIKFIKIMMFINDRFKNAHMEKFDDFVPESWANKVLQYVEMHLTENISVSQIADNLFVNRTYLTETFKEETGMTIHHYITLRRLAESQKMLYEGLSIKETAIKCGFKNTSHFTKTFRQNLGFTPGYFQKNLSDSYPASFISPK